VGRWLASWHDVVVGARFLRDLPSHLRSPPPSVAVARVEVQRRLAWRADDLLALVAREVTSRPKGLVASLLGHAGCEGGDLARLVARDGVEGALSVLLAEGVYLTGEEFKGRVPVRRGSASFEGGPDAIRNPHARFHVSLRSSGSRGAGTPVLLDLAFVRDHAVSTLVAYAAWGVEGAITATWEVPGGGALFRLLKYARLPRRPERWFSHVALDDEALHTRYRQSARALVWASRLAGRPMPEPLYVPYSDPSAILDWLVATLRRGETPLLFSFPSSALRLAQIARSRRAELCGAWVAISGEPVTATRVAAIRESGLSVLARYGSIETGALGYGCPHARWADEVHRVDDQHAFLRLEHGAGAMPAGALLVTSLRASAPFLFLNVSMGDRAEVATGSCGCPLEGIGWTTRLHTIRSFEKLTGAGMTFRDDDLIELLERRLPERFGGAPGDWQLVESEAEDGAPLLVLVAAPAIGPLDFELVRATFLDWIGEGSGAARAMSLLWRDAGLPQIEQRPPSQARSGKVLHLHAGTRRATPS
jgi:hypothetical protein